MRPGDEGTLQKVLRNGKTEQRVARRARILLLVGSGTPVQRVAEIADVDPATVWRVCRRYEERGIESIYDAPRCGRRPNVGRAEEQ